MSLAEVGAEKVGALRPMRVMALVLLGVLVLAIVANKAGWPAANSPASRWLMLVGLPIILTGLLVEIFGRLRECSRSMSSPDRRARLTSITILLALIALDLSLSYLNWVLDGARSSPDFAGMGLPLVVIDLLLGLLIPSKPAPTPVDSLG